MKKKSEAGVELLNKDHEFIYVTVHGVAKVRHDLMTGQQRQDKWTLKKMKRVGLLTGIRYQLNISKPPYIWNRLFPFLLV